MTVDKIEAVLLELFATFLLFVAVSPVTAHGQKALEKIYGDTAGMGFGSEVAVIGDVNADGAADFAVGAPNYSQGGVQNGGKVLVFSGKDASLIYSIVESASNLQLGRNIRRLGDTNGDHIPDFAVTTNGYVNSCGSNPTGVESTVSIRSGVDGSVLSTIALPSMAQGAEIAGSLDLNSDRVMDLIVGCPYCGCANNNPCGNCRGKVLVYSGAVHPGQDQALLFSADGVNPNSKLGAAVRALADVNADGKHDYVAYSLTDQSVRLFSGLTGANFHTIPIFVPGAGIGRPIAGLGDVNGDRRPDYAIGTIVGGVPTVQVFSGATNTNLYSVTGMSANDSFGYTVAPSDDRDGDRVDDFVVGAPYYGSSGARYVRVISGASGNVIHTYTSFPSVVGFGRSFDPTPLANGQITRGVIIGAPHDTNFGLLNSGSVFVPIDLSKFYEIGGVTVDF